MRGPGVTEFPAGTDTVYIIYCHQRDDTVKIFVRDSGGGVQFVNHPDGITYAGNACETLVYRERNGIAPGGSPYLTTMHWPEGPFSGVGAGIEWYVGLFIAFDSDFYYGDDALARITARDPAANLDDFALDRINVRVTSTSDPEGIIVQLQEEALSLPLFTTINPVRFSREASSQAEGVLLVNNGDVLRASYCPRDCQTAYEDTAVWLAGNATVTPTPLPTFAGPRPTPTATPPPELAVEYVTLRPAPADVGYAPQKSANRSRVNHLGYPSMYVGMWTRGDNLHHGMVQFDLGSLPGDSTVIEARLELDGQSDDFMSSGTWRLVLLDDAVDGSWRELDFPSVNGAAMLGRIGAELGENELRPGRMNSFGFAQDQLAWIDQRLRSTRRISFRVDGPDGDDNNLYAWHTGVDVYGRASVPPDPALGPRLALGYSRLLPTTTPPAGLPATATPRPTLPPSTTPSPNTSATTVPGGATSTATHAAGATATDGPTADGTAPSATMTVDPALPLTPTTAPSGTESPDTTPPATPVGTGDGRQICVVAFVDADRNGLRGPDERFLAGATLRLLHEASGAFVTWTTDGANDPDFCWAGLSDGRYALRLVELPLDYTASGPAEVTVDVPLAAASVTFAFGAYQGEVSPATPSATLDADATPDASATPQGGGTPGETPQPGDTPPPQMTLTPSATFTPTATPTLTPQPTVVGPKGQLCVTAFHDLDGNGFQDAGEPLLAGIRIALRPSAGDTWYVVTTDAAGVCSTVSARIWHIAAVSSDVWGAVDEDEMAVLLTDGARIDVGVGMRGAGSHGDLYVPLAINTGR